MPPIRRYIRISPHSCLEVRIFLENPADITTWLLRPSNPALPRVFDAVRPLILPKLREENERARLTKGKTGKKKRSVKDVVKGEDFEVVIFLTEGQGKHEIVVKRREAKQAHFGGGGSGGSRRMGNHEEEPVIIREEDDEENMDLDQLPQADEDDTDEVVTLRAGRKRQTEDESSLHIGQDDKKKLGFQTSYDGFTIWGKVLCLLVERKGGLARRGASGRSHAGLSELTADRVTDTTNQQSGAQQALMQEWISSTQVAQDDNDEDDH